MTRAARLLPPMARTRRLGRIHIIRTCRFLALGAVQALTQVPDRGLQRFHFRLQGRFPLYKALMLLPPVVRLPLELDLGLLRQDDRLLGKGRGTTRVPWGKLGSRPHLG